MKLSSFCHFRNENSSEEDENNGLADDVKKFNEMFVRYDRVHKCDRLTEWS